MHKHDDTQFRHTILHTQWHTQWLSHTYTYTMQRTFTQVNKLLYKFISVLKPSCKASRDNCSLYISYYVFFVWHFAFMFLFMSSCTYFSLYFLYLVIIFLLNISCWQWLNSFFWVFDSILQNWDELVCK